MSSKQIIIGETSTKTQYDKIINENTWIFVYVARSNFQRQNQIQEFVPIAIDFLEVEKVTCFCSIIFHHNVSVKHILDNYHFLLNYERGCIFYNFDNLARCIKKRRRVRFLYF